MSLTTCAVSCLMYGPDGEPEVGARFEAKLDRPEVAAGFIVPDRVIGTTDVSGVCVLNLWPNQLGATESVYIVKMTSPTGRTVTVTAVVPDSGTANLHDITTLPPYPGKSDGALVLEAAVSAGQVALAAADSATNSKAAAETAQAAAETAQAAAELARDTAQSSQAAAASSQSAAATSATSAAGSATAAAGSATAAASSATAAQTAKTGAESARDAAQAAATTATGAASTASSAATTATGAASTATTKASEASVSAFAAQASESNAAASEAAAAGSAATASTKAGEAAASAAAAATFDPALYVPRSGNVTISGPLSVPAGASGAQVPQAQEVALLASTQLGFRNKVVNGNFAINQDNVSGTVTLAAGSYGHDQWMAGSGGCTYTFSKSAGVTTLTITAGSLVQPIEGDSLGSGTYVLSWAGTAQGKIGAGSYGASGVTASITGGVDTTIEFNTGTLSLVQLEPGGVPTVFERLDPTSDLMRCLRYYWRGSVYWSGQSTNAGRAGAQVWYPVPMRVTPTISNYTATVASGFPSSSPSQFGATRFGVTLDVIANATVADGRWAGTFSASARL